MKLISPVFLLLAGLLVFTAGAQTTTNADLSKKIDELLSAQYPTDGPGCAALVAKNGQVVYHKAFGMADLELDVAMRPEMVFRIGSITKQFTAVAILQLMEQGKLSLQDEITKFLPDYPTQDKKITIEHLLTHTSGIRSYTSMPTFWEISRKDMRPEELIDFFKNEPMDFEPGTRWSYNNSGYFLLGYIIEKVSGKTYAQYLEDHIFQPLGMKHSYYGDDIKLIEDRASGYQMGANGIENAAPLSMTLPYAAGSIQSTVQDLYIWNQAVHAHKLIKKESLDKAFTGYKLNDGSDTRYGYGWGISAVRGTPAIGHGGGINGFLTYALYLPQEDVFVAVFSNSTSNPPEQAAIRMAAMTISKPYPDKEITLDETILKGYVGVYENDEGEQRLISWQDGRLFSKRGDMSPLPLKAYAKDKFFFDNSLTTLEFQRDKNGKLTAALLIERDASSTWKRTDKPMPVRKKVELDAETLASYVGTYRLSPSQAIAVFLESDKIFAQGTGPGQHKIEMSAQGGDKFYVEAIDATLEFKRDDSGKVTMMTLHQGGQSMEGKRENQD